MRFRLQSAIEYLSTYSWALLILAVVLGVMAMLGLFNPSSHPTIGCLLQAGFSCESYRLSQVGLLNINIQQTTSSPINVTGVGCAENINFSHMSTISPAVSIPIGSNSTFSVTCYGMGANAIDIAPGSVFSGTLLLNYTDTLTGLHHTMFGQLSFKVTS